MDRWTDGQMEVWTDGRMYGCTGGQTLRQTDGLTLIIIRYIEKRGGHVIFLCINFLYSQLYGASFLVIRTFDVILLEASR